MQFERHRADLVVAFAAIDCARGLTSAVTLISSTSIRPCDAVLCASAAGANNAVNTTAAIMFSLRFCIRPLFKVED